MKAALFLSGCLLAYAFVGTAQAEPLAVASDATIEKVLAAQVGKAVTVKVGCNEELTGKVKSVSSEVVHLAELSGKEFFDAVVDTEDITAVIIRTR